MELARYACTDAAELSDNKKAAGRTFIFAGRQSDFYSIIFASRSSPSLPTISSLGSLGAFYLFVAFLHPPELALASRGSSQKSGSAVVLRFLDKVSAPLSQQTAHPQPSSRPALGLCRSSLSCEARVYCARVVLTYLRYLYIAVTVEAALQSVILISKMYTVKMCFGASV